MPDFEAYVATARRGDFDELHELLVKATGYNDATPQELLTTIAAVLPQEAQEERRLPPRTRVVIRLLRAEAYDVAWLVLQDNAVGVVARTLRTSTSSGARPTEEPLPLAVRVDAPRVFAWLPGFRDPRYGAPESAYDITDQVRASVRLDEAWWDGAILVLAGRAHLRHVPTSPADEVTLALQHPSGRLVDVPATRPHRPDLVRGSGDGLVREAWSGWCARVDATQLSRGIWTARLLVTQQEITHAVRLGRTRSDVVPPSLATRHDGRVEARVDDGGLRIIVGSPLLARSPRELARLAVSRVRRG